MPTVSMLASVADLAASQAAGAISQLMPSGVILPFGGATAPTGWLLCNGATINRTTYAALFAAIGTAHGSGDGSTTFHLPDLRGRFVRGTDGGQARDPDRASRTAANTGGNTGDAVGSVQANATKTPNSTFTTAAQTTTVSGAKNQMNGSVSAGTHTHRNPAIVGANSTTFYTWSAAQTQSGVTYGFGYGDNQVQSTDSGHSHTWDFGAATFSASGTTPASTVSGGGDNESRPLNANVNYIIKV